MSSKTEIGKWMEKHGFVDKMQAYVVNELGAKQNYKPYEDLATKGTATINLSVDHYGNIRVTKAETYVEEAANLEADLEEAKKTIKSQEKEIESLTKQITEATTTQETEQIAPLKRKPRSRKIEP